MDELTTRTAQLPDTLEDLSQFVLVNKAKLDAYRVKLRAINRLSDAQEIREQTLQEMQDISSALIAAETRIGEILLNIPKQAGRPSENSSSGVEKLKPKSKFKVGDYVTLKEDIEADKWYGGLELLSGAMYDNAHNKRITVVRVDWSDDSNTYYYECKGDSRFTTFHYSEQMLDKWNENVIHEGDTVKVVNTGLNYSSYPQWVGKHISDPYMAARYCYGSPNTEKKYKVIKIAEHESNYRPLAYIEQIDGIGFNKCYLIEVKGLEKA